MSMTQEEAIVNLEKLIALFHTASEQSKMVDYSKIIETLEFAAAALRPVSREQVEKVWRGEWMGSADGYADGELVYDIWECSQCGYVIDEEDDPDMLPQFCPKCYAAMTDEAVQMVMERLEALKDGPEQ